MQIHMVLSIRQHSSAKTLELQPQQHYRMVQQLNDMLAQVGQLAGGVDMTIKGQQQICRIDLADESNVTALFTKYHSNTAAVKRYFKCI